MEQDIISGLQGDGFKVVEEVDVGNLDEVREQRSLVPNSDNVLLAIVSAENMMSEDKKWRAIKLKLRIENGVDVGGEIKYRGYHLFKNVCYYADPEKYTSNYFKSRQHLVEFKALSNACTVTTPNLVNDQFFQEITGQRIIASIRQVKETRKNPETGEREDTGIMINDVVRFRAVSTSDVF